MAMTASQGHCHGLGYAQDQSHRSGLGGRGAALLDLGWKGRMAGDPHLWVRPHLVKAIVVVAVVVVVAVALVVALWLSKP